MNAIQSKAVVTSFCFLLIILSGLWLSRSGKPYLVIVFTFHKLITLGTIVYLAVTLYRAHQSTPLQGGQVAAIALIAACFLAMLATGGLLSVDKALPTIVHRLHQVLPFLTAASVGITLYLTLFATGAP
jgi:hypothetical protein